MGEDTKIEWAHHTFNPWRGCTKHSSGCLNCYAADLSKRNPATLGIWGPRGSRAPAAESYWRQLAKWDRSAKAAGERHRVFVASLADVAERDDTMPAESRPIVAAARARLWDEIERCDGLDFLLLTKRPDHLGELLAARWSNGLPQNIWAGTSVEDQAAADERIPHLLSIPARVRFLSCEPLLGAVDLRRWLATRECYNCAALLFPHEERGEKEPCPKCYGEGPLGNLSAPEIHWTIVGGESGAHARPMHPAWARSLRDQCVAAGVPFHFKQFGEWSPGYSEHGNDLSYDDLVCARQHEWPEGYASFRVGKRVGGRLLDGREWNEVPGEA